MSIEAMRQALEALEMGLGQVSGDYDTAMQKAIGAVTTLRTAIEQAKEDNEQIIYDAWRDSESYSVPMTEEGERLAQNRFRTFRLGWDYHRFYLKHGDVYMKDYLDKQDYDE